jgi:retinol dehydrogenase-14
MADAKTYVVTGASQGIGLEIAIALARAGNRVVMVSRDPARAAAALELVRKSAGAGDVTSAPADVSSLAEVRRLAAELSKLPAIDALIHNAAAIPSVRSVTTDGFESTFATNVLGPFLLTHLLKEKLKRVVFFYGGGQNDLDLDDLQSERGKKFNGWKAYVQSKNALGLLTGELARRWSGSGITVLGTLPGIVNTPGMRNLPGLMRWFPVVMRPFLRTPEQGAATPVWVATAPELSSKSGKSFGSLFGDWKRELKLPIVATDPELGRRLYEICEALSGLVPKIRAA